MTLTQKMKSGLGALIASMLLAGQSMAEAPSVSGFVDFGYNYNFNKMPTNTLRTFDARSNSFTLQNAELVFEGKMEEEIGYRIDLNYGTDPSVFNYLNNNAGDEFDIEQAFITYPCPMTGGKFTFGKFVTLHGVEVIEAKDDYNISRGLLFNYAIPLHHTGIKYDKGFMDNKLALSAAVVNGWDNLYDNNKGKSIHGMVSYAATPKVSLTVGGTYGPEQSTTVPSIEKNARSLVDTIIKFTPTDKLTLVANHDWGVEEGADFDPVNSPGETATWQGLGVHANYAFTDTFSAALRFETFDDNGATRTALAIPLALAGLDPNVVVNSYTATLQCTKGILIKRLEFRQDKASKDIFTDSDGAADDVQSTIGLQFILPFGGQ